METQQAAQGERFIKITEMARLHGISRQTLIFYDREGIFSPHHLDDSGYRVYSTFQIPRLREICLLKSLGVSLEEIRNHLGNRDLASTIELLKRQKNLLDERIAALDLARDSVSRRLESYEHVPEILGRLDQPFIQELPARKAAFFPYGEPLDRNQLHLTLMKTRRFLLDHKIVPASGFGAVFTKASVDAGTPLRDAGSISFMPDVGLDSWHILELHAGPHACMYKYGMPYDEGPLKRLLGWMAERGLRVGGTVVDVCILDTTFHTEEHEVDLCLLQVPVQPGAESSSAS